MSVGKTLCPYEWPTVGSYRRFTHGLFAKSLVSHLIECIDKLVSEGQLPPKLSTYCPLLLIKIFSWRLCGGVDFLQLIRRCIMWDDITRCEITCWVRIRRRLHPGRPTQDSMSGSSAASPRLAWFFAVSGFGSRVSGLKFWVFGLGFGVWDLGLRV